MVQTSNQTAVKVVTGGAIATNGTFTVNYPAGKTLADYENAVGHYFLALGAKYTQPDDFTIAFNAGSATITYKGATTIPAGIDIYVQLEEVGTSKTLAGFVNDGKTKVAINGLRKLDSFQIDLGAPATADADGVSASQALTAASTTGAAFDGAIGATLDMPRGLVAAWTNTAVLTFEGLDAYGQKVVEKSASGTSFTGKKAFAKVTKITTSADVTGLTVGTAAGVIGLPVYLPTAGYVNAELQDGATVGSAGTFAAGLAVNTPATATNADIRGTYTPNAAPDGAKSLSIVVNLPDPTFLGNPQYAG